MSELKNFLKLTKLSEISAVMKHSKKISVMQLFVRTSSNLDNKPINNEILVLARSLLSGKVKIRTTRGLRLQTRGLRIQVVADFLFSLRENLKAATP